jgi:hypothetical protein
MQSLSEMKAIFESLATSMQSLPVRTTGQDFLHSWRHFYEGVRYTNALQRDGYIPLACTVLGHRLRLAFYNFCALGGVVGYLVGVDNGNTVKSQ